MKKFAPAISSIYLAVVVSAGTMLLWLGFWSMIWGATKPRQWPGNKTYHDIVMNDEGRPIIRASSQSRREVQYRTFSGEIAEKPKRSFSSAAAFIQFLPRDQRYPIDSMTADQHLNRVRVLGNCSEPAEQWFLVHDGLQPGGCWLEAHRPYGTGDTVFIGKSGESSGRPAQNERFQVSLEQFTANYNSVSSDPEAYIYGSADRPGVCFLAAADYVYQVSLEERRSVVIAPATPEIRQIKTRQRRTIVLQEKQLRGERASGFDASEWLVALLTTDSVVLMDGGGGHRVVIPIPTEFRMPRVDLTQHHDSSITLQLRETRVHFDSLLERGAVFDVAEDGSLTNRRDYSWVNPNREHSEAAASVILGIANPTPILTATASIVAALTAPWTGLQSIIAIAISTVSGILSFSLCLKHQSTCSVHHKYFWLSYSALFGVFGYIGYRYHRTWPDSRFSDPATASFTVPKPIGLEVFA